MRKLKIDMYFIDHKLIFVVNFIQNECILHISSLTHSRTHSLIIKKRTSTLHRPRELKFGTGVGLTYIKGKVSNLGTSKIWSTW